MSANSRWYVPTPAKYLLLILFVQGFLGASAYCQWFEFNRQKGLTVVVTFAVTCLLLLLLACWLPASRLFKVRPQFSLATLMFMVLVMVVPCAWLANEYQQAREQRNLVQQAKSRAVHVGYDNVWPDDLSASLSSTGVPQVLLSTLGNDFFAVPDEAGAYGDTNEELGETLTIMERLVHLKTVWLMEDRITDAKLTHLQGLTQLESLTVHWLGADSSPSTPITDDGLAHLKYLHKLRILELDPTSISDTGLEYLIDCTQLTHIRFGGSQITDTGVAKLASRYRLTELGLAGSQVTDAGLEHLGSLPQLEGLSVSFSAVTDKGLVHLKGHTNLVRLNLCKTNITDVGLAELAGLTKLEELDLSSTAVTDAGLEHLARCIELTDLDLSETAVTDDGLAKLLGIMNWESWKAWDPAAMQMAASQTKSLPKLRRLDIRRTKVTDFGPYILSRVYPQCVLEY